MTYSVEEIECNESECTASVKNHRWGKTKASDWFFGKDGTAYCPEHLPDWVAGWRAKRAAQ